MSIISLFMSTLFPSKKVKEESNKVTNIAPRPSIQSSWLEKVIADINEINLDGREPEAIALSEFSRCAMLRNLSANDIFIFKTKSAPVVLFSIAFAQVKRGEVMAIKRWLDEESGLNTPFQPYVVSSPVLASISNLLDKGAISATGKLDSEIVEEFLGIVQSAAEKNASDIHFCVREPNMDFKKGGDNSVGLLFRLDGRLVRQSRTLSYGHTTNMIRAIYGESESGANDKSSFSPSGSKRTSIIVSVEVNGVFQKIQLRFQSIEAAGGYDVIMRLLWQSGGKIKKGKSLTSDLIQLGYLPEQAELIALSMRKTSGGLVFCGPTGAGKTTTLYSALTHMATPGVMIRTAEDPVEVKLFGVSQHQVTPKEDQTTGKMETKDQALSLLIEAFLRADPDICMVSEIRGADTAGGFEALVSTGHLTLTTLHTESAMGAFYRLNGAMIGLDLHTLTQPDFLSLICFQKLVRSLCKHCKLTAKQAIAEGIIDSDYMENVATLLGNLTSDVHFKNSHGCAHCFEGESDRTVCASVLMPDNTLLEKISKHDQMGALRYWESQKSPLWDSSQNGKTAHEIALFKMSQGLIDPREVEHEFEPNLLYIRKKSSKSTQDTKQLMSDLMVTKPVTSAAVVNE
ncbi:GspE/PulE family protein [Iodobacter fluviatilis]|uniref:Type II secretory ATPase GspE/PulE/Tfp pilus assembly ATPase PilB-like protein n=1 Tax=Iodobacter fluviatilis TaxID=537 RepID=A0A377Q5U4_9NEIS|nr:ATPase, T2SS/T4P/T4SS family [Iodobacter fluviatilis]TCU84624.1 type II secretory ATPase GspE/PulE/Tfp pilus assembly ATPase PilB-like protein [Iodobacter fluviatilis]STQ90090.1 Type II traffic warden ATPase [Iodobacter fluviatilis]